MRPIKFRQPIMRNGKFQSWHYWGFISKGNFSSPANEWVDGEPSQEFTSLVDKNGKEIYEGDIAKITWKEVVIHDLGCNEFEYTEIGQMVWLSDEARFTFSIKDSLMEKEYKDLTVEVIGNKYENPELIALI